MKTLELAFSIMRRKYPGWMHLILAAMIVLGLGMAQSVTAKKPILTKSGKIAALEQAATAILQAPTGPGLLGPAGSTDETKVPHYYGPFPN